MNSIRTISSISRGYHHARRYNQILSVLFKNGFGFLFERMDQWYLLKHLRFWRNKAPAPLPGDALGNRLKNTLIELGPTFIKFGQMLSCRPDVLPADIIEPLVALQNQVPPFPFSEVERIIQEELGKPIGELFAYFSNSSCGSASISQGYRATLRDGRQVFVKIQRPGIAPQIMADLEILELLADYLQKSLPELAVFRPVQMVKEFRECLLEELDFLNEAGSMRAFWQQFRNRADVLIPEPIGGYCTRRVLTMSFMEGIPFSDIDRLHRSNIDCNALAGIGVDLLMQQYFIYGFFHGDPHPGNMMALPGPKIVYLDFGIMGRLTQSEQSLLLQSAEAMFKGDMKEMAHCIAELSLFPDDLNMEELERALTTLVATHLRGTIIDLDVMQFTLDFYKICRNQRLCLKPHFCRMIRALGYADAMGRSIAPDFKIFDIIRDFVSKQALGKLNPLAHLPGALRSTKEWIALAQHLPVISESILHQLSTGTLSFNHRQRDVRQLSDNLSAGIKRLSNALLLSALLLSATMLLAFRVPPLFKGCSAIGLVAFSIASTALLFNLLKNRR